MFSRKYVEELGIVYEDSNARKVWVLPDVQGLPEKTFLVQTSPGDTILLNRGFFGRMKYDLIQKIARQLFEAILGELTNHNSYRQLLVLRGAYPFDLQEPSELVLPNKMLPTTFLKLQRVLDKRGQWKIEEKFFLGSWEGEVWFIPDTAIASGSTIAYLLEKGFQQHIPDTVVVLTVSGSIYGMQRIAEVCEKNGVNLISVFASCLFDVSEEGNLPNLPYTDLPILNRNSIAPSNLFDRAERVYQDKRMCSVGDVGDSLESPFSYLIETLREISVLQIDPNSDHWSWVESLLQKDAFRRKLEEIDSEAYKYFQEELKGG